MENLEPPVHAEASVRRISETRRLVVRMEKGEFEVCQPIEREKSEWMGLRKKRLLIHRTSDGEWDIRVV